MSKLKAASHSPHSSLRPIAAAALTTTMMINPVAWKNYWSDPAADVNCGWIEGGVIAAAARVRNGRRAPWRAPWRVEDDDG